ncbi:MAG: hypothetical protein K0U93_14960 [Gammaproteobacteria bacterium]|nr:hypothetical protein [Gammaproteobacteria bacterium]
MKPNIQSQTLSPEDAACMNGGCLIDDNGTEIPITPEMVSGALSELHAAWEAARRKKISEEATEPA